MNLLERDGCATVGMGIEAANARIRHELLKRRMTKEQVVGAQRGCFWAFGRAGLIRGLGVLETDNL